MHATEMRWRPGLRDAVAGAYSAQTLYLDLRGAASRWEKERRKRNWLERGYGWRGGERERRNESGEEREL